MKLSKLKLNPTNPRIIKDEKFKKLVKSIQEFIDSGVLLYNEIIKVDMIGNLPMRAGRYFNGGRKVGKQHQNVLVFYKGNPKNIKQNYPELDLSYIEEQNEIE